MRLHMWRAQRGVGPEKASANTRQMAERSIREFAERTGDVGIRTRGELGALVQQPSLWDVRYSFHTVQFDTK